jgi:hypothetical protein
MRMSDGRTILLFRCHKNIDVAKERIKIIKHFNPGLPVYVLFGGQKLDYEIAKKELADITENVWLYSKNKDSSWKWFHTDLMTKEWFRDFGHTIKFDFLYSYEYDLLTLQPLEEIYPDIDSNTLALAAVTELTEVEWTWSWTSTDWGRPKWLKFKGYMKGKYGLEQQKYVCLGPGPLLPRQFLEKFAMTDDIEWVHEEITLPAYAEVFGFKLIDHGMHPGFKITPEEKYFSCRDGYAPSNEDIKEQMKISHGRRTFHPVKQMVTLDSIMRMIKA